jgi:AbrB family looped-hinge helix DNA binding protein
MGNPMETTKLSSKGQVIIPKPVWASLRWASGQELVVIHVGDSVLLRPKSPFPETTIDEVAGCLQLTGKAKTLDEMEQAIAQGVRERHCGDD